MNGITQSAIFHAFVQMPQRLTCAMCGIWSGQVFVVNCTISLRLSLSEFCGRKICHLSVTCTFAGHFVYTLHVLVVHSSAVDCLESVVSEVT